MYTLITMVIIYFLLFNIITTLRLIKSDTYEPKQKLYQMLIIWLIPVLGVILVAYLLNDEPVEISENIPTILAKLMQFILLLFVINYIDKKRNSSNAASNTADSFAETGATAIGGD